MLDPSTAAPWTGATIPYSVGDDVVELGPVTLSAHDARAVATARPTTGAAIDSMMRIPD